MRLLTRLFTIFCLTLFVIGCGGEEKQPPEKAPPPGEEPAFEEKG
jgi:hypothetical protein